MEPRSDSSLPRRTEPVRQPDGTDGDRPIAVIGLSCRLPGAQDTAAFWQLLRDGTDAVSDVPADRWTGEAPTAEDDPDGDWDRTRRGGFLDRVDGFDPAFFGISPREAAAMDPQQRLVLELGWEALEDAGIVPARLAGSRTGVFVGAIWDDYAKLLHAYGFQAVGRHSVTGLHRSVIANRLSYALGLRGPSMTVDTAQSSALVAVHLAVDSLRSGATDLAIAGGVNLNLAPESALGASRFGGLSPDGRCYTFDARANGYVRGEGGGLVVLKPLDQALRDGDDIVCVIRGSAVNNDGATDGLTVPSAAAQADVVRAAHEQAGITPDAVQYVELHGTGTPVGDPVEAAALGEAIGRHRPADHPLAVGSAKTNVGHLEGAAGIVGLLKVALSIRHRRLPPSLNYATPNPAIPLDELRLRVQTGLTTWPQPRKRLIAGVSSFGMGGTNCHVVLTEAPRRRPTAATGATRTSPSAGRPLSWLVSARGEVSLRAQAARLAQRVRTAPETDLLDLASSLTTTRSAFENRAGIVGTSREELLDGLTALASGDQAPHLLRGTAVETPRVAFLFSGQGSQRAGMGRELYDTYPVFAQALDEVCALLDPHLELPLRDVMFGEDADLLGQTLYTQTALFAFHTALFKLLDSFGVRPDFLAGHSIGEISAAHAAGVLTLEDAAKLVSARARLMQQLPTGGTMIAVEATETEILPGLDDDRVSIAAINSPTSLVLSGDHNTVTQLAQHWKNKGDAYDASTSATPSTHPT
ncbi:type I polyketide synthase [Streptomyces sp. Agncl-13]|uniref:type I polyketide synthase n=1 Tax=Streptomyces sp. Agncl-13 TaxID=3400628 RepID=UPI003A86EF06